VKSANVPSEQAGRADGLHGSRLARPEDEACLRAEPAGHPGRDEEQDQSEVREQRGHLRVPVSVAVHVAVSARLLDPDGEPVPTENGGHVRLAHSAHGGAVR